MHVQISRTLLYVQGPIQDGSNKQCEVYIHEYVFYVIFVHTRSSLLVEGISECNNAAVVDQPAYFLCLFKLNTHPHLDSSG